jgi:hypothetical protein
MGNDYQLKRIYEQMLQGKKEEPSVPQKPRTLNEAYQQMVNEATGFYAMDMNTGTGQPRYNGLKPLGVIADERTLRRVKSVIASEALGSNIQNLIKSSGWTNLNQEALAVKFADHDILNADVEFIVNNKQSLDGVEQALKGNKPFNVRETTIAKLKNVANIEQLFDDLFNWADAKTGLASIGRGEIALSLLTSGKKAKVGDLVFGKTDEIVVEVKGTGGRIGKAPYAADNAIKTMQALLKKSGGQLSKRSLQAREEDFQKRINELLEPVKSFIADEYIISLKKLLEPFELNTKTPKDVASLLIQNAEAVLPPSRVNAVTFFQNKNFIHKLKNENDAKLTPDETKNLREFIEKLKTIIKQTINDLSKHESSFYTGQDIESLSFKQAALHFFLENSSLTIEQATEALLSFRNYKEDEQGILAGIQQALSTNENAYFNKFLKKDERALKALVFAVSMFSYAKHANFTHFLTINDNTKNAMPLFVHKRKIIELADLFYNTENLDLDMAVGSEHGGASHINYTA